MITDIRLQHFRSYSDASFAFRPGVNSIVGPNASGKTNLLEAVLTVARGSSYRANDAELISFGAPWARLDAHTPSHQRVVKIMAGERAAKSFEIDEQKLVRLHATKLLPVVLFEPNHLLLLHGAPDLRRAFMDDLIEQTDPRFGNIRRHYRRVLAQRNALLKKDPPGIAQQLFVWNVRLSELGGQIARQRQQLIARCNEHIAQLYSNIADQPSTIQLRYASRFPAEAYESAMLSKLEANPALEVVRGFTAYGPHRDDMEIFIDGHAVRDVASRGETRTLVLAFKLLEVQELQRTRPEPPMLLLDDVFSELDLRRRQALTHYVERCQTFITTTDADIVAQSFTGGNTIQLG